MMFKNNSGFLATSRLRKNIWDELNPQIIHMDLKEKGKKPTPHDAILSSARKEMNEGRGEGTNSSVIVREGGEGQHVGGSRSTWLSHYGIKKVSFQ